jgi:hypothetical protein
MGIRAWVAAVLLLGGAVALAGGPDLGGFSHDGWTRVLEAWVDEAGMVDYSGLSSDRADLDRYVEAIGRISPENRPDLFPTREDRLAYWINAYNALVFQGVLARGPEEDSVWTGMVSGLGFFGLKKYTLGGRVLSLKTLEDDLIREPFQDPRIHAALNCASIGCPRLPRRAFEPATLHEDLEAAMAEFVAGDLNVTVDHEQKTVTLSKIFDWFEGDFLRFENEFRGRAGATVVDYINRYREGGNKVPENYRIKFRPYDKRINKQ